MRMVDLISKKRNNVELTRAEIDWIINGYTNKEIPDYLPFPLSMLFYLLVLVQRFQLLEINLNIPEIGCLFALLFFYYP